MIPDSVITTASQQRIPTLPHSQRRGKPIPILLMVQRLGIGGCERDLTKVALGLDRTRFEPHVACVSAEGPRSKELRAAQVPIIELPTRSLISRSALEGATLLASYIRKHHIQIAHAFDAPMEFIGLPVCRLCHVPVIIKSHLWYRNMTQQRYRPLFTIMDKMADAIFVNSEAARRDLAYHGGNLAKTFLCHNGVDTTAFRPRPDEPPMEVVRNASLVVGCVCAIRQEKRLDLLMRAFSLVQGLRPGMRLLIVGSGPIQSDIARLRAEWGLASVCHLEPIQDDVSKWMRSIHVFVQASDSESFPNALLEAMACGCCVIASRVGGIPELITDKHDGLLFEPGNLDDLIDKLSYVIENEDLRLALASRAADTAAEQFSIDKVVDRMQLFYESVLERKTSRI